MSDKIIPIDIQEKIDKAHQDFEQSVLDKGEIIDNTKEEEKEDKVKLVDESGEAAQMPLGTLYDVNKTLVAEHEKPLSMYKINNKINGIINNFIEGFYYMLLCRERNDYTVFNYTGDREEAAAALKDCILNRGECRGIQKLEDGNYEIWIYNEYDKEAFVYYLFSCNNCIVKC